MKHKLQDVDLRLLRIFRVIADCRGLTPAANELNTTVAAISTSLSDLEVRLGFTLCTRGRSGFRLTEEGIQLYRAHTMLLRDLEAFADQLGDIAGSLAGEVRLALVNALVDLPDVDLPGCIRRFKDRFPNATFTIETRPARDIEEALLNDRVDIGISVRQRDIPEFSCQVLATEKLGLYCGSGHELFDRDSGTITRDDVERFERCYRDYIRFADGKRRKKLGVHTAEANDLEAQALMILSGRFLGMLPNMVAERWVAAGRMKAILPEVYEQENQIVVYTRKGKRLSKTVEQFLDDVCAHSRRGS